MVSFLSQRGYFLAKGTILKHALLSLAGPALKRGSFKAMIPKAASYSPVFDVMHLQFLGGTVL